MSILASDFKLEEFILIWVLMPQIQNIFFELYSKITEDQNIISF